MEKTLFGQTPLHPSTYLGCEIKPIAPSSVMGSVGILGAGNIGTMIGQRALNEGRVVRYSSRSSNINLDSGGAMREDMDDLFLHSQTVFVALPHVESTHEIVNKQLLQRMANGSKFELNNRRLKLL